MLSSTTLRGDDVVDTRGESLGKIEDFMIELQSGKVGYAVMSFGGVLGIGDKLFAVPWSALRVDTNEKRFVLDSSREKLERAPGFDKKHWPDFADPGWASTVERYYGAPTRPRLDSD
jgi:sporulation protein YlmC with PRC-barrel domain